VRHVDRTVEDLLAYNRAEQIALGAQRLLQSLGSVAIDLPECLKAMDALEALEIAANTLGYDCETQVYERLDK
jgi:hypothetical protein